MNDKRHRFINDRKTNQVDSRVGLGWVESVNQAAMGLIISDPSPTQPIDQNHLRFGWVVSCIDPNQGPPLPKHHHNYKHDVHELPKPTQTSTEMRNHISLQMKISNHLWSGEAKTKTKIIPRKPLTISHNLAENKKKITVNGSI